MKRLYDELGSNKFHHDRHFIQGMYSNLNCLYLAFFTQEFFEDEFKAKEITLKVYKNCLKFYDRENI